jgi:hypothetical protein
MISMFLAALLAAAPPPEPATGTHVPKQEPSQPVQQTGNPRDMSAGDREPSEGALKTARSVASCVVQRRRQEVQWLLQAKERTELDTAFARVKHETENCLEAASDIDVSMVKLNFGRDTMLSLFAEALFLRTGVPELAPAPFASASDIGWMREDHAGQVVLQLASCLAYTQPGPVAALLRTRPSTPEENAALAPLIPVISSCLERNVTLRARKAPLRLGLALAYYRRTVAPAPQQAQAASGSK